MSYKNRCFTENEQEANHDAAPLTSCVLITVSHIAVQIFVNLV